VIVQMLAPVTTRLPVGHADDGARPMGLAVALALVAKLTWGLVG